MRRREFLGAAAALSLSVRAGVAGPPPQDAEFSRSLVFERARQLAATPFARPEPEPAELTELSAGRYAAIQFREDRRFFADPPTGFAVELLHPGSSTTSRWRSPSSTDGTAQRVAYDPGLYGFGDVPPPAAGTPLEFAGFRALTALERAGRAHALRDLRRRELLPGDLQGPDLRPQRPGPRDRHRRGGRRGVPVLPRPLDRDAGRGPHGGALAARRAERHRRLPLHHPARRHRRGWTSRRRSSPAPTSRTSGWRR